MDLELVENGNGGDLVYKAKDLSTINGFQNMIYLALFGGNVGHVTPTNRPVNTQAFDWWGNNLFFRDDTEFQMNSLTESTLRDTPLTSTGLAQIEQAVIKDLEFMKSFTDLEISVELISDNKVKIEVFVNEPDNKQNKAFVFIWDATKVELPDGEVEISDPVPIDPPLAPQNLSLTPISTSEIDVDWDVSSGADSYVIEWDTVNTFDSGNFGTDTSVSNSYSITGLDSSTLYYVRVKAVNIVGDSPYSTIESATTEAFNFKTALRGDGVNDYVQLSTDFGQRAFPQDDVTTMLWFKYDQTFPVSTQHQTQGFNNFQQNPNIAIFSAFFDWVNATTFNLNCFFVTVGGLPFSIVVPITANTDWNHLAIRIQRVGGDDVLTVYLNGVQVGTNSVTRAQDWKTKYGNENGDGGSVTLFTSGLAGTERYAELAMDQFVVLEQFDTAAEIANIYNNGNGIDVFEVYNSSDTIAINPDFNEADDDPNGNGGGGDNTLIPEPSIVDRTGNNGNSTAVNFAKTGTTSNWIDH